MLKQRIKSELPDAKLATNDKVLELAAMIQNHLDGEVVVLPEKDLDLSSLTLFQRHILCELRKRVPCGKTISYSELANLAGKPKAARAVGSSMRKNPFPLFYPCHRVIKSNGDLGEFQPGVDLKKRLLELEEKK